MKFSIRLENAENLIARLEKAPALIRKNLAEAIAKAGDDLADYIRMTKLSGTVLQARSGALRRSIRSEFTDNGKRMVAKVGSHGIKYAAIHEYGGVINHPGSDKLQVFKSGGKTVFAHGTRPHKIPMPMRSYLRDSLSESREVIVNRMREAIRNGVGK